MKVYNLLILHRIKGEVIYNRTFIHTTTKSKKPFDLTSKGFSFHTTHQCYDTDKI